MHANDQNHRKKRYHRLVWLCLPLLLYLSGCSGSGAAVKTDRDQFCSSARNTLPPQNAPDDCLREVCIDGLLTSVEDLTETAPVSDWAEEAFCLIHPIDCFNALKVVKDVRQWEHAKAAAGFWDRASLQGGLGDAARHAYVSCLLAQQFGLPFATGLMNAHEGDSSVSFGFGTAAKGNRCCDKVMDLHNNRVGRELAGRPGSCEEKVMAALPLLRHSLCSGNPTVKSTLE